MALGVLMRLFNRPEAPSIVGQCAAFMDVRQVVVVVDSARDTIDTPSLLAPLAAVHNVDIVALAPYGWSRALNAGMSRLMAEPQITHVLCVSDDAVPTPDSLEAMTRAVDGASCVYPDYRRPEPPYRIPRNTCVIWNADVWHGLGGFDESLDNGAGMEDYDMALRAYSELALAPRRVAAVVDLSHRTGPTFARKTTAESKAMTTIAARHDPEALVRVGPR